MGLGARHLGAAEAVADLDALERLDAHERGGEAGLEFFAGYLVEKSLSIDNVFVFILVFNFFHVPPTYQHKVLFWGIVGAIVLRAAFIIGGLALLERFHWTIYVFGAFLVFTGIRMAVHDNTEVHPERNPVLRLFRRLVPMTAGYQSQQLTIKEAGKRVATPLLAVLIMIETTDILFAVDSIPAIFAVTREPFIVFTSNAFAILGLRALYFLLAAAMREFHYLKIGLGAVLSFVGLKMLASGYYHIPILVSLIVVGIQIFFSSFLLSILGLRRRG